MAWTISASVLFGSVARSNQGIASTSSGGGSIVLRAAEACGTSLTADDRRVIEDILLARAWDAGIIVCHDGNASPGPQSFDRLCAQPGPEILPFWWDLRIEQPQRGGLQVASATLRLALSNGPPKNAPEIFLLGPFVLPPGLSAAEVEPAALQAVASALSSSAPLFSWLQGLSARHGLLRVRPAPMEDRELAKSPEATETSSPDEASADEVRVWSAEILRITDLLIDGGLDEARQALAGADRLLQEARLPADIADRSRQLREKAQAKLDDAERATAGAGAPALGKSLAERPVADHLDLTFLVRLALVGQGFGAGPEGRLHVTQGGIAFQRNGAAGADWSVSWANLMSAVRDEGLWESPFTILLTERGGRKRYLSLLDGHHRFVAGDALLNAIAKGKRAAFQRPRGSASSGGSQGVQGEGQ